MRGIRGSRWATMVAVCAVVLCGVGASTARATSWSLQTLSEPAVADGSFGGLSCSSSHDCLVASTTGLVHWNGSRWASAALPTADELESFACAPDGSCFALAYDTLNDGELSARWNGRSWSVTPVNLNAPFATAMSCLSGQRCVAVGSDVMCGSGSCISSAATETWNGRRWQTAEPSIPFFNTGLNGVSCTSARLCAAVGYVANDPIGCIRFGVDCGPLAGEWNGRRWSWQQPPGATALNGVACASARACLAVGGPLVVRFDGRRWTRVSVPRGVSFSQVSCSSASACTLASDHGAWRWNGVALSPQPLARPRAGSSIAVNAVDCLPGGPCLTAGSFDRPLATAYGRAAERLSLLERQIGGRWHAFAGPDVLVHPLLSLTSVSCATTTACLAVGSWALPAGTRTVAATWRAGRWSALPTPAPLGRPSQLSGVSCLPGGTCQAVGSAGAEPLLERWSGRRWTAETLPGAGGASLAAVSCPNSRACLAVGSRAQNSRAYAAWWDGARWSPRTRTIAGLSLDGVSCPTLRMCMAIGYPFNGELLLERWNGSTWSVTHRGYEGFPGGIACSSPQACTAVAGDGPFIARWDGVRWTPQSSAGGEFPGPYGVSCPTNDACELVGQTFVKGTDAEVPLAEHWDGTAWIADPLTAMNNAWLQSVSCPSVAMCVAVGPGPTGPLVGVRSS